MYKKIIKLLLASLFVLGTSSTAFAFTIAPNQSLSLDSGGATGFFITLQGGGDTYRAFFSTNGTGQTGNLASGKLDSLTFNSVLSSVTLQKFDGANYVNTSGNLTGASTLNYSNVNFSSSGNVVAGIGGTASGTGSFNVNGTIGGNTLQLSGALAPSFMDFTLGGFGGAYDAPINAFSSNGRLNFALDIDGNNNVVHGWIHGNSFAVYNGVSTAFGYGGDLNSALGAGASVPEPATMGLILSGLVGVASRKRKLAKV